MRRSDPANKHVLVHLDHYSYIILTANPSKTRTVVHYMAYDCLVLPTSNTPFCPIYFVNGV